MVDTYLLVQMYDITMREITSYGLKEVAIYFGITDEESERTYIEGSRIQQAFFEDRPRFCAYARSAPGDSRSSVRVRVGSRSSRVCGMSGTFV